MTREELAALFADVIGLRLRPTEVDTLLMAVDNYTLAQVTQIAATTAEATAWLMASVKDAERL